MPVDRQWLERARQIVGPEGLLVEPSELEPYAHDEYAADSYARVPAAVLKPAEEGQVAGLVRLCAQTGVALTPRGGGTGLAAACVPCAGGVRRPTRCGRPPTATCLLLPGPRWDKLGERRRR